MAAAPPSSLHFEPSHAPEDTNFAKMFGIPPPTNAHEKRKMPPAVVEILRHYLEDPRPENLEGTTVKHAHTFLEGGRVVGRLEVFEIDFGYSRAELEEIARDHPAGERMVHVVKEIVGR